MPAEGRYRLLASTQAGLQATVGATASGIEQSVELQSTDVLAAGVAQRFGWVGDGATLALPAALQPGLRAWLTAQLMLVREDSQGRVLDATYLQIPGVLDARYASADDDRGLGVQASNSATQFRLWAPTARAVTLCLYADGRTPVAESMALQFSPSDGGWSLAVPRDLRGLYYNYLVEVFVAGIGIVRNRVTDPYSISLGTDSARSYIADLDDPALKPDGWDAAARPHALPAQTDMAIYELHVRDFSIGDASVPAAHRGKYLAFTDQESRGMRHLRALADAGITDIHLLPVFDIATIPEQACVTPAVPQAAADSEAQQAVVMAAAATDCFNWGYDPLHYSAPEGSYATDAGDGAVRIREFRAMVQALHAVDLRVGMDVVYNHTSASGQDPKSVLDRIVPGYYQRLDGNGAVDAFHLLREHGHRASDDGEADAGFGGDVGARLPHRLVPLRPDGAPAARGDGGCEARGRGCGGTRDPDAGRRLELRGNRRWQAFRAGRARRPQRKRDRHLQRPCAGCVARWRLLRWRHRADRQPGPDQWPALRAERVCAGQGNPIGPAACVRPGACRPCRDLARLLHAACRWARRAVVGP